MPITDASGHIVPAGSDALARSNFLNLSASINGLKQVANATARAQLLADLAAATPSFVPTAARRLYVQQTDTGEVYEYTSASAFTIWGTRGYSWESRLAAVVLVGVSSMGNVLSLTLPTDAPAGVYAIDSDVISRSDAAAATYVRVQWAGGSLPGNADAVDNPGGVDVARTVHHTVTHTAGGAATILLGLQINGGTSAWNRAKPGTTLRVTWLGRA